MPELAVEQEMRDVDELGAFLMRSSASVARSGALPLGGAGPLGPPGPPGPLDDPVDALLQPLGPPGAGVDSGLAGMTMSAVSHASKMGFTLHAANSSEALMSAALLDADKVG